MGQNSILTETQKLILAEISQNKELSDQFYFTGGTALSEVYLKHRYSDDLDFFTPSRFETQSIFTFLNLMGKKYQFSIQAQYVDPVYICNLSFQQGEMLRLDFGYYPYKQLKTPGRYLDINVDSLFDLTVNKVLSVTQRTEVKDYVDLYFLLERFALSELIDGVKIKFNSEIDPLILASHFMLAEDFKFLPRMIKPLTLPTLHDFFIKQAQKLGVNSVRP